MGKKVQSWRIIKETTTSEHCGYKFEKNGKNYCSFFDDNKEGKYECKCTGCPRKC
jgi:hypothetical protein